MFELRLGNHRQVILNEALYSAEKGLTERESLGTTLIQPSILGSGGKIIIDRIDPYIRRGWSMIYKNPDGSTYTQLTHNELNHIVPTVSKSFKMIQQYWPEMARNISAAIRKIHIVNSPHADLHLSCSNNCFFGSILVSTGSEYQLSEALVHEYSHNILDVIIASGELFDGEIVSAKITLLSRIKEKMSSQKGMKTV
jgi:hypothetical protein